MIFHHVLMAGEVSADKYFQCVCQEVGCSMKIAEKELAEKYLLKYPDGLGRKACQDKPSVCVTEGSVGDWESKCGTQFAGANKSFVILRDPLYRVYAEYFASTDTEFNKAYNKWYDVPPLPDLVMACKENSWSGKGGYTLIEEMCPQLSNQMVHQIFAMTPQPWSQVFESVSAGSQGSMDQQALDAAKSRLGQFSAVFLIEEFPAFKTGMKSTGLFPDNAALDTCNLGHETFDWTDPPHHSDAPIPDNYWDLIKEMNALDIELYNYARSLPNYVHR